MGLASPSDNEHLDPTFAPALLERVRWGVGFAFLLGCGHIGFDPIDAGAGSTDGGDGGTGFCPHTYCTFEGITPCSCWGTPVTSFATIDEVGGSLQITPAANQVGAQGACVRENVPFGGNGVIVEVSQIVTGSAGFTAVRLGEGLDSFQISVEGGLIVMRLASTLGSTVYDPAEMRFWRVRPLGTTSVEVQTSPDGENWLDHISVGRSPMSAYTIQLIAGTPDGSEAAPGSAVFESISVCPP